MIAFEVLINFNVGSFEVLSISVEDCDPSFVHVDRPYGRLERVARIGLAF